MASVVWRDRIKPSKSAAAAAAVVFDGRDDDDDSIGVDGKRDCCSGRKTDDRRIPSYTVINSFIFSSVVRSSIVVGSDILFSIMKY